MKSRRVIPRLTQNSEKYLSISIGSKTSLPAGTGVCVVKTLLDRAAYIAVLKSRFFPIIYSRILSTPRKAA